MRKIIAFTILFLTIGQAFLCGAQPIWHGVHRKVHYLPEGTDFLCVNGTRKFNRALYGSNTGFRVEAGDLPEFALYLPGMGGNLQLGFTRNGKNKWLTKADRIEARYRPGSMIYTISDTGMGKGLLQVSVLPLYEGEGMILKIESRGLSPGLEITAVYGGVSGQKFSRDGDIGADPESVFYLKPEYGTFNLPILANNQFRLHFGYKKPLTEEEKDKLTNVGAISGRTDIRTISGVFPVVSALKLSDAKALGTPEQAAQAEPSGSPVVYSRFPVNEQPLYVLIKPGIDSGISYAQLPQVYAKAEAGRKQIAGRIDVRTPDIAINTLGAALGIAADAIWESPTYLHGAVAWRMRLNGWRGAYAADVLGWHDRARQHFDAYLLSQVTAPEDAPIVMDTTLRLARGLEKMGTSLFSNGYIARNPNGDLRPHHYDMNLVFMDQILNHLDWTGDKEYLRKIFPAIKRHLAWEKRNFDRDNDGLYDAYAAIWASDALQYSGGGVTHSSAYNYRCNVMAAQFADLLGEDPGPYKAEAAKILNALNEKLWLPGTGSYGEYVDLLGKKLVHPSPGLWTVYHAIDSKVPDPFQSWQLLQSINRNLPQIPVRADGWKDTSLYTLPTTNWQPYTWSLNNVALGELMHTALAYWQGGRNEEAYRLWKSTLVESMYLGVGAGNFHQLSFYDAMRGELYRDFADGIGMTARSLVEGLFGIKPALLSGRLSIQPGFPSAWNQAYLQTPDVEFTFSRKGLRDRYLIRHRLPANRLSLKVIARNEDIAGVLVNGRSVSWQVDQQSVGRPMIVIQTTAAESMTIEIAWKGGEIESIPGNRDGLIGDTWKLPLKKASIISWKERDIPEQPAGTNQLNSIKLPPMEGSLTLFARMKQGAMTWWHPVQLNARQPVRVKSEKEGEPTLSVDPAAVSEIRNPEVNGVAIQLTKGKEQSISGDTWLSGTNRIDYWFGGARHQRTLTNWDRINPATVQYEKVDLQPFFNDMVTRIFQNEYLSPRPRTTTLQLPVQGIGNWAYPLVTAVIDDSGLRNKAGTGNEIKITQGIPFATPSSPGKNIAFTSQWSNYPEKITVPLTGRSSHAYLLMAGSTNAMQSRVTNGLVVVTYTDGTKDSLDLRNPENWWPIEQDLVDDGYAFTTGDSRPVRVYLKTGADSRTYKDYTSIKGFTNRAIDGGAATVLDLPLNKAKTLKSLSVEAVSNDVVIGLMSLTLVRKN